jgi:ribose-phosphate pyrophosphokinase
VRERDAFVLQSIALDPNRYLVELLIMIDALKRSSAKTISAIIPYYGFCRQDRKDKPGVPITAKLIANLLSVAGITRVLTVDLHAGQIEGFFEIPVDHLHCQEILVNKAIKILGNDCLVVAPDIGSVKVIEKVAKLISSDFVVIDKQRLSSNQVGMTLIGNLTNKKVLIVDDICSTATTLTSAAQLCKEHGAETIVGMFTHAICCEDAVEKLESSAFDAIITTNTAPSMNRFKQSKKIQVVSIAPLIAKNIEQF